jgi:hypothetical protein
VHTLTGEFRGMIEPLVVSRSLLPEGCPVGASK